MPTKAKADAYRNLFRYGFAGMSDQDRRLLFGEDPSTALNRIAELKRQTWLTQEPAMHRQIKAALDGVQLPLP